MAEEETLMELCGSCREKVSDLMRRESLRGLHYGQIVAETHATITPGNSPPQHKLDITKNYVREHIVSPEQLNILPPLPGQEGASNPKRCDFRIVTGKSHPEIGDHQLTLCLNRYGQIVTTVSHPISELSALLARGNYLSRDAQYYMREHPIH